MASNAKLAVGAAGIGALGLLVGFSLGNNRGFDWGIASLKTEVSGTLATYVEVASYVRIGDTERALALLDRRIDTAVLSLSTHQESEVPPESALRRAKLYRSVVPSQGPQASDVQVALDDIPPLAPSAVGNSGLGRLVGKTKR